MQCKFVFGIVGSAGGCSQRLARKIVVLLGAGLSLSAATCAGDEVSVVNVKHSSANTRNAYYAGYREPLRSTPLVELPVGAVRPLGWLRKQLTLQAAGFHGHLGDAEPAGRGHDVDVAVVMQAHPCASRQRISVLQVNPDIIHSSDPADHATDPDS